MATYNPAFNVSASTQWAVGSGGHHLGADGVTFFLADEGAGGWRWARFYRATFGGGWSDSVLIATVPNANTSFTTFEDLTATINGGAYRYWVVGFNEDFSQCGISPPHFASQVYNISNESQYTLGSDAITTAENSGSGDGFVYGSAPDLVSPYAESITFSNLFETWILDGGHVAASVTISANGYTAPNPDPGPASFPASADFIFPTSTVAPPSTFFQASVPAVSVSAAGGSTFYVNEFALSEGLSTPPYALSIGLLAANGSPEPVTGTTTISTVIAVSYVHDVGLGATPFDSTTLFPGIPAPTIANPGVPTPLPCIPCCAECNPVCHCPPPPGHAFAPRVLTGRHHP